MCLWYTSALSPKPVHVSQWALHLGLSVLSLDFPSSYPPQAPIVFRYCVDSDRPVFASKVLVSGSTGPSIRPASTFSSLTTSPQPPSLSASSSRAPQASFSCLATPAICQGCGILLLICCSGWLGLAFFLSRLFPAG